MQRMSKNHGKGNGLRDPDPEWGRRGRAPYHPLGLGQGFEDVIQRIGVGRHLVVWGLVERRKGVQTVLDGLGFGVVFE